MNIKIIILAAIVVLIMALTVSFFTSTDNNQSADDLKWNTDMNSALNMAQNTNKLILVDVYAPWCGYCKEMDKETLQNPEVQQKLSNYVLLRINGDENPELMQKYQVYGYPTVLIIDPRGNLVKRIYGYQTPQNFVNMI